MLQLEFGEEGGIKIPSMARVNKKRLLFSLFPLKRYMLSKGGAVLLMLETALLRILKLSERCVGGSFNVIISWRDSAFSSAHEW